MNKTLAKFLAAHYRKLGLSIILTLLFALAFSIYTAPIVARHKVIAMLSSDNPDKRDIALNYIIRHTSADSDYYDPEVLHDAIAALERADDSTFRQLSYALSTAGQWRQPGVPDGPWLRWVESLAKEKNPGARVSAVQELGYSPSLTRNAKGAALLDTLSQDADDDVRYNALVTAAIAMSKPPSDATVERVLARSLCDKNPEVARQAWIFLGLAAQDTARLSALRTLAENAVKELRKNEPKIRGMNFAWSGPSEAFEAAMEDQHDAAVAAATQAAATQPNADKPRVFQALVWAEARLGSPWIAPPADILECKPPFTPAHASAFIYALSQNPTEENADLIGSVLARGPSAVTNENYGVFWRAALTLPLPAPGAAATQPATGPATQPASSAALLKPFLAVDPKIASLRAISLAAGYRLGVRVPKLSDVSEYWAQLATLAAVESPRLALRDLPINEWQEVPDILRIMAVSAATAPTPDDLYPVFVSEEPTIRDLACIVASDRFTSEQNAQLVRRGLSDYNDNAKMTGAILAGLTGQSIAFLQERQAKEDEWLVKQVMSLGLWMQGKMPTMSETAVALLTRDDMPRSTLLLAMIHCHAPLGKEYLFNPRGEPSLNLRELFDQKRWWTVLRRYLPKDAPPFWIWADTDLTQFQVDVLRDWYLIYDRDPKQDAQPEAKHEAKKK